MIDYSYFFERIEETPLRKHSDGLAQRVNAFIVESNNGDMPKWIKLYNDLPLIEPSCVNLDSDYILIGERDDCPEEERDILKGLFKQFHPWRKGPYDIFGIKIESEWRSDMKWARLKGHLQPLKDRCVLDVGSGNGYYCLKAVGSGAKLCLGIDIALLYVMQFNAIQKYVNDPSAGVLPLGIDDLPENMGLFDTVFSMGVIYHRKDPLMHLRQLMSFLRSGGEVVVESLVIDGKKGDVLAPTGRYAKMPNVHFIPSTLTLEDWLEKNGFTDIKLVSVGKTTSQEQRVTEWMGFQSLDDFLDPKDKNLTVEGYPAPKRAVFLANKP